MSTPWGELLASVLQERVPLSDRTFLSTPPSPARPDGGAFRGLRAARLCHRLLAAKLKNVLVFTQVSSFLGQLGRQPGKSD